MSNNLPSATGSARDSADFSHPWTRWWQEDLPCQFSPERSKENSLFLAGLLGSDWLTRGVNHPGASNHPFFNNWGNIGANSFFELNVLAEDLRRISNVPGIETIVHDLRSADLYNPTKHTVHMAALFSHAQDQRVIRFFEQTSSSVPDFALEVNGESIAVEAKLFRGSKMQDDFTAFAEPLHNLVLDQTIPGDGLHPIIMIVIKDAKRLPNADIVLASVSTAMQAYKNDVAVQVKSELFNVFIVAANPAPRGVRNFVGCFILSPRTPEENLRVQDRSKQAAGQLRTLSREGSAGIICLGLNYLQDAHDIATSLNKRFQGGYYTSVSMVLLTQTHVHSDAPERCWIDLVTTLRNPNARTPMRSNPILSPVGRLAALIPPGTVRTDLPAYRFGSVRGIVNDTSDCSIVAPNVLHLTPEMLS